MKKSTLNPYTASIVTFILFFAWIAHQVAASRFQMTPRGQVDLIFAEIGRTSKVFNNSPYTKGAK